VLLAIVLAAGVIVGAVATRELCIRGHCGNEVEERNETTEAAKSGIFPTGASEDATPTSTSTSDSTTTCGELAGDDRADAAPSSSTADTFLRPGVARRCQSQEIAGLAIVGDSTADEYRADNPRGGDYGATTFNWVELLANERAVNLGEWGERPEPRRSGYAFNWARSGATSETMISGGQHTGVSEQILAGDVSHVIIQIGVNDFYYDDVGIRIYDGTLAGPELQQFIDGIVANVETAVVAIQASGDAQIMVVATQDFLSANVVPGLETVFPDPEKLRRLTDAFGSVSQGLSEMAARTGVSFYDYNAALQAEIASRVDPNDPRYVDVGGAKVDRSTKGNDPLHLFVDDDYAHPSTVLSGLIGNLIITAMNCAFGTQIETYSDAEILRIAGVE
jgi:lysophospholipase L1-like esterase